MKIIARLALLCLAFGLAGCGDYLGDYTLEEVRRTGAMPEAALDDRPPPPYPEYLRVELSSEASLYAAKTGAGLYVDGDFCPLRNPDRFIAFGPVALDGSPVEDWKRKTALQPDPRDGRYHYLVFVAARSPARKLFSNATDVVPGYDLATEKRDLCLRFFVPGYNIIPSRSGIARVPAAQVAAAFAGGDRTLGRKD